jgi:hypothetical protein
LCRIGEQIANLPHGGDRKSENIKFPNGNLISSAQAAKMVGTTAKDISMARTL